MSTHASLLTRMRRRLEITVVKTALCLLYPLETFLEHCSEFLKEKEPPTLMLGKAVYRCYLEERTTLQMQKLMVAYQLHLSREELVANVRENRQLRGRLQMYEYEEDAAQVNRNTLLDLHREKYEINERNCQLRSELSRTEYLLQSIEKDIDAHTFKRHPKQRTETQRDSSVFNNACSCSFEEVDPRSSSFTETGTVKVYSSVSTESFELDSTWVSKHQIIVHVSSNISPKPD